MLANIFQKGTNHITPHPKKKENRRSLAYIMYTDLRKILFTLYFRVMYILLSHYSVMQSVQMGTVFAEMSSWTVLTWHKAIETAF